LEFRENCKAKGRKMHCSLLRRNAAGKNRVKPHGRRIALPSIPARRRQPDGKAEMTLKTAKPDLFRRLYSAVSEFFA
jgi:hypothetical protein